MLDKQQCPQPRDSLLKRLVMSLSLTVQQLESHVRSRRGRPDDAASSGFSLRGLHQEMELAHASLPLTSHLLLPLSPLRPKGTRR